MREKRIACDNNVGAGDDDPRKCIAEPLEKLVQFLAIMLVENREPRQRGAFVPVERRRNTPDAATSAAKFCLFLLGVLNEAVGRIGDDGMDRG